MPNLLSNVPETIAARTRTAALLILRRATVAAAIAALAITGCSDDTTSPVSARVSYGTAQPLGQGTVSTFITRDDSGKPATLGIALSEAALQGLPTMPMPGMPSAAMLILDLPPNAAATGFDHVMLDWNPMGHEPEHVYTEPHFDFHFYQISSQEREAIVPSNPAFAAMSGAFPSAEYVPTGYQAASALAGIPAAAAAVPLMGMHWLDVSSPELQPPPAGKTFTTTFLYGTYDGKVIFLEPMITKAYIESIKTKAEGVTLPIGVAARVAKPGTYPTAYSIKYDATTRQYRIILEGLTARR
jgi:hypothetical protein